VNFGLGLRVFLKDWFSLQVDLRDHVYSLDLLGRRQSTQNLELSAGATFFF
jgi:outer membrane beta-barrel protein